MVILFYKIRRKGTTFFLFMQIYLRKNAKKSLKICICAIFVVNLHPNLKNIKFDIQ